MTPSDSEDEKRSATIAAVLGDIFFGRAGLDSQTREAAAQLMAHLYKNGHRTADQLKEALSPATLQARFG